MFSVYQTQHSRNGCPPCPQIQHVVSSLLAVSLSLSLLSCLFVSLSLYGLSHMDFMLSNWLLRSTSHCSAVSARWSKFLALCLEHRPGYHGYLFFGDERARLFSKFPMFPLKLHLGACAHWRSGVCDDPGPKLVVHTTFRPRALLLLKRVLSIPPVRNRLCSLMPEFVASCPALFVPEP